MYYYSSALVKAQGKNADWMPVDISGMTMQVIHDTYQEGYVGINIANQPVYYVLLSEFFSGKYPMRMSLTLNNWLAGVSSAFNFPRVSNATPTISKTHIAYQDAIFSGYTPKTIPPASQNIDNVLPFSDRTDLLLSRPTTDASAFVNNCVVTVNGILHYSEFVAGYGVRVVGGGATCWQSAGNGHKSDGIGILSFAELGGCTQVPVTSGMVSKVLDSKLLSDGYLVNLGMNITGKSVLMSLAGYLHVNDDAYTVINPQTGLIKVNLDRVQLQDRIFESRPLIDMSSVPFSQHPTNPQALAVADLTSDAVLGAYITLCQSFFIVVNTPTLYLNRLAVERTDLPNIYYSGSQPTLPLALTTGYLPEYWPKQEDDMWVLSVVDNRRPNYLYKLTNWKDNPWIWPGLYYPQPYGLAIAEFLDIYSSTVVTA